MGENEKVISLAGARDKEKNTDKNNNYNHEVINCSFCGRPNHLVIKMVKGPGVNICSECVMICVQYLILQDRIPSSEVQKLIDALWQGTKD